jgi:AcrR family transcriptional regulator
LKVTMTGEATRAAIRTAAVATFCRRGYSAATLEEVGGLANCTRGTVLHHFNSKAELLSAVTEPYLTALGELLHTSVVDEPPPSTRRRDLLERFADLFLEHRAVVQLLTNDVAARAQLGLGVQQPGYRDRLVVLLIGGQASRAARLRTAAALGSLIEPIAGRWLEFFDAASRDELIESALVVIERPTTTEAELYRTKALVR